MVVWGLNQRWAGPLAEPPNGKGVPQRRRPDRKRPSSYTYCIFITRQPLMPSWSSNRTGTTLFCQVLPCNSPVKNPPLPPSVWHRFKGSVIGSYKSKTRIENLKRFATDNTKCLTPSPRPNKLRSSLPLSVLFSSLKFSTAHKG